MNPAERTHNEDSTVVDAIIILDFPCFMFFCHTSCLNFLEFGVWQPDSNYSGPECSDEDRFQKTFILRVNVPVIHPLVTSCTSAGRIDQTNFSKCRMEVLSQRRDIPYGVEVDEILFTE
jgi:hypothetical protein